MGMIQDLTGQFTAEGVEFREGSGGLPKVVVKTDAAEAEIYLQGATVTGFHPRGAEPVIFLSAESLFRADKAIRGGIPICWPWFGPKWDDPKAPQHGLVRAKSWDVASVRNVDSRTTELKFQTSIEGASAAYTVIVSDKLHVALESRNASSAPMRVEEALHTYLVVGDSRQVGIVGLADVEYVDKVDGGKRKRQDNAPIRFTMETDRVYLGSDTTCVLSDPVLKRKLVVAKTGSRSTVIWNPWVDKAKALADFGDDEWQRMCCIETANAMTDHYILPAGHTHATSAEIGVERI